MASIKYIAFGAVAAGGLALLWFGPRTAVPAPPGRVVVHYWEHWAGKEADAMQGIVDDFNNTVGAQKGIYVEFLSQANINQKVQLAAAAGVPPDVAGLWDQPLPQWAALDALEPLDDMAAAYGINETTYKDVYWKGCHYKGKLIALLSTPNDVALLWNKQCFEDHSAALAAAGLDPRRSPRTLDELDRYARVLEEFDHSGRTIAGGKAPLLAAGYLPTEPGWYIPQTLFWFGANIYDEKLGRFTLDSPQTIAALNWIAATSQRLSPAVINDFHAAQGPYASAGNPFLTGQLQMQLQGPWVATVIEQFKPAMNRWHMPEGAPPDKLPPSVRAAEAAWAAAPLPSVYSHADMSDDQLIDQAVTWCGFDALVIPRGAAHKAEAFEFIAYVQRQEVMEKLCALHCKNTPLRQHSATWYTSHPNPYAALFDRLADSAHAVTVPPVPVWPEAMDEIASAMNRVAAMEQTPEAAAAELQRSLQAKLEQFRERHP